MCDLVTGGNGCWEFVNFFYYGLEFQFILKFYQYMYFDLWSLGDLGCKRYYYLFYKYGPPRQTAPQPKI